MERNTHRVRWYPPFGSEQQPTGIYLLHGLGEHSGRYARLAEHLAASGWRVAAHDHPGHGRSTGQRGAIDPAGCLATRAAIEILTFGAETGTAPIVLGHSLGAVLATELVQVFQLPVAGLILSAPAYVPKMTAADRFKLKLLSQVSPELCLDLGYDPTCLTHDADERAQALADPLNHGFKSAKLVNWLIDSGQRAVDDSSSVTVPTLFLIPDADPVVHVDKTREFASKLCPEFVTICEYQGAYHEVLNESPRWRDQALKDIDAWLREFAGVE